MNININCGGGYQPQGLGNPSNQNLMKMMGTMMQLMASMLSSGMPGGQGCCQLPGRSSFGRGGCCGGQPGLNSFLGGSPGGFPGGGFPGGGFGGTRMPQPFGQFGGMPHINSPFGGGFPAQNGMNPMGTFMGMLNMLMRLMGMGGLGGGQAGQGAFPALGGGMPHGGGGMPYQGGGGGMPSPGGGCGCGGGGTPSYGGGGHAAPSSGGGHSVAPVSHGGGGSHGGSGGGPKIGPGGSVAPISTGPAAPGVDGMLDHARSMIGLHEVRDRDAIYAITGKSPQRINPATTPWCAAFAMNMINDHGLLDISDLPNRDYCPTIENWARKKGIYGTPDKYQPKPGDAIMFDWERDGTSDHIGLVEKVVDGKVYTIEGNSKNSVKRNVYDLKDGRIDGYVSVKGKSEEKTKSADKSKAPKPRSSSRSSTSRDRSKTR